MIVQTFDGLQALTTPQRTWSGPSSHALHLDGLHKAYAEIYRTQPNVRICVDFLARNIAQLTPQVYRRVSATDRIRLADHDLARWMGKPNPATRRYRLVEDLMGDMGVYFNGYWVKVRYRDGHGRPQIGLVGLPPDEMTVDGGLLPTEFCWAVNGKRQEFAPSEIVHFSGYNPLNRKIGLSPLETLRNILSEDASASSQREAFWRNSSRMEGVWELDKDAPAGKWTPTQKEEWRRQWQEFAGGGSRAGTTAMGPTGAHYKELSFSAKDSEYIAGGKLRREVCAAAYNIPLPLVGILDHATFSNVKEQHKHLYQDCLGPWLEMLQQEIEGQLLVECEDQADVYVEFNIDAKLAGTPEERAQSLSLAIGRPWRTVNEGRALENLPRIDDPELDTVAPQQGGPSDATVNTGRTPAAGATATTPVLQAHRARQMARLSKLEVGDQALAFYADMDRWNRELADDLTPLVGLDKATRLAAQANTVTLQELVELEAAA